MAGQNNNEQILLGAAEDVAKRLGVQTNQLNALFASLTDFKKGISRDFVTLNDYNRRIVFGINDANKHLFNIQNMLSKSFANDAGNLQREDKFPLIIKRTFDKLNKDVAKLSSNLPKNAPDGKPQNKLQEQQTKPFETKLEQTKAPSIIVADFEPEALGKIASILPNAIKKGVKDLNKSIKDLSKTFKEGIDSTANAGGGGLLGGIVDLLMLKLGLKGLFGKGAVPPPLPAAGGAAAGGLSRGARALRGVKIGGPLAALFAGYDFMSRIGEGQTTTQAAIGTGAGVTGGIAGAALGQMLIPIPVVGAAIGGVVGSMSASWLADQLSGASRKETRVKGKQYTRDEREQQDKLENYVLSTRKYRTVQEFIQAVNRGDEKPIRWNSKTRQYEPYFDAPDKNKPSAELPPPTTPTEVKPPSATTTPPSTSRDTPKTKQEVDRAIDEQLKKIESLGKNPEKNKTQIEEEFKKLKKLEDKLNEIQSKETLSKPTATQAKAETKQTATQAKAETKQTATQAKAEGKPVAPQKTFVDEPEFQKFVEKQNPGLIERQQSRLNEEKEFRKTFDPLLSRNDKESLEKWEDDKKQSDLLSDRTKATTDELTKLYREYIKLQQEEKATKTSERVTKDEKQADVDIANAKKEQAEIAKKIAEAATANKTKIQDGVVSPKEGLRVSTPFGQLFETHPRDVGVFAPEDAFKQLGKTLQNLKNPQNVDNNAIKEGVKEAKITNNKLDVMANNFSVLAKALEKMGVNIGEKMQNPVFVNAASKQNRNQEHAGTAQDLSNMSSSARMYTAYAQNLRPFAV